MRRSIGMVIWLLMAGSSLAYGQSGEIKSLHELINAHRETVGCDPLAWHANAAVVAQERSADMDRRNYFDHKTPEGRTFIGSLKDAGIETWGSVGDNIALTQAGPASVLELWIDSEPHRRNLEYCAYTHQAIGESSGFWTQILLARPKEAH
ncbi:MAG: CAP domain-containing protein [Gemmatimonadales bacterium]|nr:MAG: CAP domain-containing protein [Gemmatimonadales bacterium]